MKNFFKKSILIASFWLFLSSFLFASGYRYNIVNYETGTPISQKDNSELTCTNYLNGSNLYIKISFKESSPSAEQLKKLLEGAEPSIEEADQKLDNYHGQDMTINYIFYGKDGEKILTASYVE